MWILTKLPEIVIHLILIAGILGLLCGFVLGFIPVFNRYKLPIQIISVLVFALGVYLEGGLANEKEWKIKEKEMEAKIAKAEAEANKVNTQIVTKTVTKTQVVKEKGDEIIKYVEREIVRYNNECKIPDLVIQVHDAAALNKSLDPVLTPNTSINTDAHNAATQKPSKSLLEK